MFLNHFAHTSPDKLACVMAGSGTGITYWELNRRTIQGANVFRSLGLVSGDRIAIYSENNASFLEITLACIRCGLYFVPVGKHLKEKEVLYILQDSGAKVLVASVSCINSLPVHSLPGSIKAIYVMEGQFSPFARWDAAVSAQSDEEDAAQIMGSPLFYSSGTTGQPKGIRIPLTETRSVFWREALQYKPPVQMANLLDEHNRSLVTGPMCHISPWGFACVALVVGGTAVIMEKFDAEWALMLIEQYRISHLHMVPTMFVRLLRLDAATRTKYDISTLRHVEHNSAPCPIAVKERLIEWLGPIVYEVYGASEPAGATFIKSDEWLLHKGSVGRAVHGKVHVLDVNHEEVAANQIGEVFFSDGEVDFEYLNAPDKKRSRSTLSGWFSYGDIGYVDVDGYLYLVDRKDNMIIVGGENVYPLEIENHLIEHPSVYDVAVVGVPDVLYGQQVRAFVQLRDNEKRDAEMENELVAYCQSRMADFKCPASIEFVDALPRTEHGKLLKRYLSR